ncbi:SLC13 family permease [Flammeovirga kamogawensis]|uniref:SLC13 family permease n=1 Tax=Flammeovirga kamogawensis TaxID=373891 RepID=A0ABX8GTC9_9BACT|nr:SLC13 family permease [Flammeovirga kamogawensis]MBB6462967.1 di/tricarboxylate transporter [Flammeovirga kamogawensis]QWG06492.1 SLC13 family permease [Flammeovirga kamogawensis]TRX68320.1 SLC13 family permease [Flammeovirga kamogawensis]
MPYLLLPLLRIDHFLPIGLEKWIVLFTVIVVVISLLREWGKPSTIFFISVVSLMLCGIVTAENLLKSMSNPSIATIIVLVIVTTHLYHTFNTEETLNSIIGKSKDPKLFLLKITTFAAFLSSFTNNTPVVAGLTPYVYNWCKKMGAHPSKLLIPLSFSTILGGMITLIGTSTNLVLNGFIETNKLPSLAYTDFLYLGLLVTFFGILYLVTFGYNLLPENKEVFDDAKAIAPEYLMALEVHRSSRTVGKKIVNTKIRDFEGAYLIEIHRNGEVITPIPDELIVRPKDQLMFMGQSENIMVIVNSDIGLDLPNHEDDSKIVEAVIPANSALSGKKLSKINFKETYDVELVAIHRNGQKVTGELDKISLQAGDMLLISAGDTFFSNISLYKEFYVLSTIENKKPTIKENHKWIYLGFLGVLIFLVASSIIELLSGAIFALAGLLLIKATTFDAINKELDLDLVVLLMSALTLGEAFISTGASHIVSTFFIKVFLPFGVIGVLIGLFLVTILLTSFVTNVAAIAIAFPIAYSLSQLLELPSTPFFVAIAFGASAAFLTPVSYQTNWIVYGPGGYRTKDFMKIGLPLMGIYCTICIAFIIFYYGLI